MMFAIGCDLEQVERFVGKIADEAFCAKIYTKDEVEYCKSKHFPEQHLAVRYCAKEAVVKALSDLGVDGVYYSDVEVCKNPKGVPSVCLHKKIGLDVEIKISLSHCKDMAMAQVLIVEKKAF